MSRLTDALEQLIEAADIAPDPNCSCHIAPPCGDCVEWSFLREALQEARDALAEEEAADPGAEVMRQSMERAHGVIGS